MHLEYLKDVMSIDAAIRDAGTHSLTRRVRMWAGPYLPAPQPEPMIESVQGFLEAGWTVRGVPDEGVHIMVDDVNKGRIENLVKRHCFLE